MKNKKWFAILVGGAMFTLLVLYLLALFRPAVNQNVEIVRTETPTSTIAPTNTATFTPVPSATSAPTNPPPATPTSIPKEYKTRIRKKDGVTMVYIPAGTFLMGSDNNPEEQPIHSVTLDSFWMDQTEVQGGDFAEFIDFMKWNMVIGGGTFYKGKIISQLCDEPTCFTVIRDNELLQVIKPRYASYPITIVSWYGAYTYCRWAGGRLPTEAEWEYAARGGLESKEYPWGNDPPLCGQGHPNGAQYFRCNNSYFDNKGTVPVKKFQPNGYGLYDMSGNAAEWVNDWYDPLYYQNSPSENPMGPKTGQERVLRGGSSNEFVDFIRVSTRMKFPPDWPSYGFRCVIPYP